ncbi:vWA domain-containing protein [Polyangium jinanense]|uniref:VWA domain-containing protein n=1 Tax=Polyangium jinanense TaxID=2829994 RepID=A0A9X3X2S9_9BACT|nr:VWA domain-containing protein [Polyangium jinanense]MDC3952762.1 VWA domain-containing protein [Polyangium jinanense]MDC3980381.1 VWA domain-containing protein [Polyangium jinanense]
MKNVVFIGSAALSLIVAVGLAACGADEAGSDFGGYSEPPGESSGGNVAPPPAPPPSEGTDAGTDAAAPFACDGLDKDSPVILYLSADDSNSMGSPVQIRELLNKGITPSASLVRTYEFLNYYRIQYPAPPTGELSILPHLGETKVAGELDLQLGVRSYDAVKPRRPVTITFVLDTSGSMGGEPIERERATITAIAQSLAEGDIVNAVTWNTSNNIVLSGHKVTGPNDPQVLAMAASIEASGGTDLSTGLAVGYQLAGQHYGTGRLNRVILISDGGANVGVTDEDLIGLQSEDADKEGIYLVGVGAGPGENYNDLLMDTVTDKGRGAYVYLDNPAEATRMFVDRFDETMEVAARGVQVEITLPWYMRMFKFYGEEYSTNPEEVEPQHLAPSDAMIFNQVIKACDPSVVDPNDSITVVARWKTPLTYLDREVKVTMTLADLLAAPKPQLAKGKAIVAYAEALKNPSKEAFQSALTLIEEAKAGASDPELDEIAALIAKHPVHLQP